MKSTASVLASLRYRRPYWMMFLSNVNVDNWQIYTKIHEPDHQRHEMLYQTWLGGLDRPYTRPKCMAHQPTWLAKKRHLMRRPKLDGAETPLEKYVLEWHKKFRSFEGTVRPSADDLHIAFDLVDRPLDLSYACQLLHHCRNTNNIRLDDDSFEIFLEACIRVDRKDVAKYAFENAEALGFWNVSDNCKKYLLGEQTWFKQLADGSFAPAEENTERNASIKKKKPTKAAATAATPVAPPQHDETLDDEIARLQAELDALEKGG